jgi:hypothetical protein
MIGKVWMPISFWIQDNVLIKKEDGLFDARCLLLTRLRRSTGTNGAGLTGNEAWPILHSNAGQKLKVAMIGITVL